MLSRFRVCVTTRDRHHITVPSKVPRAMCSRKHPILHPAIQLSSHHPSRTIRAGHPSHRLTWTDGLSRQETRPQRYSSGSCRRPRGLYLARGLASSGRQAVGQPDRPNSKLLILLVRLRPDLFVERWAGPGQAALLRPRRRRAAPV